MARGRWFLVISATFSAFILTPSCGQQFEQINMTTPGTQCNMSSKFKDNRLGESLDCHGAINGNNGTVWRPTQDPNPNCVSTAEGDPCPFWQVDLGQPRNIHRIIVYSPDENKLYMQEANVSVDANPVFTFPQNQSCIGNPEMITLSPPVRGRIIKLTRPVHQYLTICELRVDGCAQNRYDAGCTQVCSYHCMENGGATTCDSISGYCLNGCELGWYGQMCTKPCGCDGPCLQEDGHCDRCLPGLYGTSCEAGCGRGCLNKNCSKQNGACLCDTRWSPPFCKECFDGFFGRESCKPCGQCANNDVCEKNNGHCPAGCADGYSGDLCDRCSVTRWSFNCSLPCGQCAGDGSCDMDTGRCLLGCLKGFEGDNCTTELTARADTQDTAIIIGSVLGAAALIGVCVFLSALIFRRRGSRDIPSSDLPTVNVEDVNVEEANPSDREDAEDPEADYESLDKYENPNDIKPYHTLQIGERRHHLEQGQHTHLKVFADQVAADYQNITGNN